VNFLSRCSRSHLPIIDGQLDLTAVSLDFPCHALNDRFEHRPQCSFLDCFFDCPFQFFVGDLVNLRCFACNGSLQFDWIGQTLVDMLIRFNSL
jgi:hypothetical protein